MKFLALSLFLIGAQSMHLTNQEKLEAMFRSGDGYSDKGTEYYDRINSSVGDAVIEHYSKLGGGGEGEAAASEEPKAKKDDGKKKKPPLRKLNKKQALQALTSIMYANEDLAEDNFDRM